MKPSVIAVLDVGKTNKKLSVYDRSYNVLAEERTKLQPGEHHGVEVESTGELLAWVRQALKKLAADHDIKAVSITMHGATGALLGEDGKLAHPVISYTTEKGSEIQDAFYAEFGERDALHRTTCTPDLGMANLGKAFYYVKTQLPDVWAKCKQALFYNGYIAYELTGKMSVEYTYLGNHSYLWNFHEKDWSHVAKGMGVDTMFPSTMSCPWERLGTLKPEIAAECGVDPGCLVTMGLHDSNANFLPYIAKRYENFILNSTGTWCVAMRQSQNALLTDDEVAAKVLYNLDALGNPLKTSIFPAGMEFDTFSGLTETPNAHDFDAIRDVVEKRDLFVIPGVLPDAAAFPGAAAGVVEGGERHSLDSLTEQGGKPMTRLGHRYRGALSLSLALATREALTRCGMTEGTTVFIEGGFAVNKSYCALLAALCPKNTIALTNMKEGTSFGAAVTGWMAVENLDIEHVGAGFEIETSPIQREDFGGLTAYTEAFRAALVP